MLTFALAGRTPVRYPILLRRAEELRLDLALPTREAVPDGFVYVPPGRFLFGTSSDESVRQGFLSTVPVHEVSSPAYLIGRFEVTYADWLEYLRALPPSERAARAIHVPASTRTAPCSIRKTPTSTRPTAATSASPDPIRSAPIRPPRVRLACWTWRAMSSSGRRLR